MSDFQRSREHPMAAEVDPFDIATLEKSVNESAASVSTIWASYILFGLYLVLTAGSVTQRQLLLQETIRLPVLNIDLPMVEFFAVAPALFVISHWYVLMQAVMLARTAAIYNQAVETKVSMASDRTRLRLRLANNLFAQIFAGGLRKGEGSIGWLFRQVAWVTLAVAPLFVLSVFEYKFLPYHSRQITWTHRVLALFDILAILLFCFGLAGANNRPGRAQTIARWKILSIGLVSIAMLVPFYAILLSFPGERQARWTRYLPDDAAFRPILEECRETSWLDPFVEASFDRIALRNEAIIDDAKLGKIEGNASSSALKPYLGERTRIFRNRDFRCASFEEADLRRVDFGGADLSGSDLAGSKIGGALFDRATLTGANLTSSVADGASFGLARLSFANLQRAELRGANFQGASLEHAVVVLAQLQNADFSGAWLRDALLSGADIRGGKFVDAQLQGTNFRRTLLQGADFSGARLQGADFVEADVRGGVLRDTNAQGATFLLANLRGATLSSAQLQGASFVRTHLQGANLNWSQLQGVVFFETQLQGANFGYSAMDLVYMLRPFLWQSTARGCDDAMIEEPQLQPTLDIRFPPRGRGESVEATPESVTAFIDESSRTIPDDLRQSFETLLRGRLASDPDSQSAEMWRACAAKTVHDDAFQRKFANYLIDMACNDQNELRSYIEQGVLRTWTTGFLTTSRLAGYVSSGLANSEGKPCASSPH